MTAVYYTLPSTVKPAYTEGYSTRLRTAEYCSLYGHRSTDQSGDRVHKGERLDPVLRMDAHQRYDPTVDRDRPCSARLTYSTRLRSCCCASQSDM